MRRQRRTSWQWGTPSSKSGTTSTLSIDSVLQSTPLRDQKNENSSVFLTLGHQVRHQRNGNKSQIFALGHHFKTEVPASNRSSKLWRHQLKTKTLRCAICCRCFGLYKFVAVAFVSEWCPCATMYDLLTLFWSGSGAPVLTKMCDLLPLLWSPSGVPVLRHTICCRCFGRDVVPQCQEARFVAVALVSKWCSSAKKYDLFRLPWCRSGAPKLRGAFFAVGNAASEP